MDWNKLPFEDRVTGELDRIAQRIQGSRLSQRLMELHARFPKIPEKQVASPLGSVKLPEVSLPAPTVPRLDPKKMEAMKAAVGVDLAILPGLIPVLGDYLADVVEDTFGAKLRESLSPQEYAEYQKQDKIMPFSTIALARTFVRR